MSIRTREQRFDLFITVLICFLFLNLFDNDSEGFRRHLSSNYLQYFATSTLYLKTFISIWNAFSLLSEFTNSLWTLRVVDVQRPTGCKPILSLDQIEG
jgi:hypothetical protein